MTFVDPLLEREFLSWHSSQHVKVRFAALCVFLSLSQVPFLREVYALQTLSSAGSVFSGSRVLGERHLHWPGSARLFAAYNPILLRSRAAVCCLPGDPKDSDRQMQIYGAMPLRRQAGSLLLLLLAAAALCHAARARTLIRHRS